TGVERANLGERGLGDLALAVGRALKRRVVHQDRMPVRGELHVELDPRRAFRHGLAEARERVLGCRRLRPAMGDHAGRHECRRHAGAYDAAGARWPPRSPPPFSNCSERSAPVCWSTRFIDSLTLPRSSKPRSFTFTVSPSFTTSPTLPTRCGASSEMWTRPSLLPRKFTNAPKSMIFTTLPV